MTLSAAGSRHELQAAPTIFGEDDRGAVSGESDHLTSIAVIEAAEAATATRSKIKGLHYQRPQLPAAHRERIASFVSGRGLLSVLIARPIRLVVGKNLAGQQVSAAPAVCSQWAEPYDCLSCCIHTHVLHHKVVDCRPHGGKRLGSTRA